MITSTVIRTFICITVSGVGAEVFPVGVRRNFGSETVQRISNPHAESIAGPDVDAGALRMRTAGNNARCSTPSTGSIYTEWTFLRLVHPTVVFSGVQGAFHLYAFRLRQKQGQSQDQGQSEN